VDAVLQRERIDDMALRRGSATPVMALQDARTCLLGKPRRSCAASVCCTLTFLSTPRFWGVFFLTQYIVYLRWNGLDEYHRSACNLHHVGEPARYPAFLALCRRKKWWNVIAPPSSTLRPAAYPSGLTNHTAPTWRETCRRTALDGC